MTFKSRPLAFKALSLTALTLLSSACANTYNTAFVQDAIAPTSEVKTSFITAEKLLETAALMPKSSHTALQDPLAMHAAAHDRVNPDQTRGRLAYTHKSEKTRIFGNSSFRSLTMQPKSSLFNNGFDVADISILPHMPQAIPQPDQKPGHDQSADHIQLAQAEPTPQAAPQPAQAEQVKEPIVQRYASAELADEVLPEVLNMRMGDYEDKTRLVFDLSAAAKYDYDLNNLSSVLTVHIDGAGWNLESQRYFDGHPLIESYAVEQAESQDTMLQITLKKPSRMLMSGQVRPDSKHGHRIFFDVAAL